MLTKLNIYTLNEVLFDDYLCVDQVVDLQLASVKVLTQDFVRYSSPIYLKIRLQDRLFYYILYARYAQLKISSKSQHSERLTNKRAKMFVRVAPHGTIHQQ